MLDASSNGPLTIRPIWAGDARIGSIIFAPIRVADGDELVVAAMLVLTMERAAYDDGLCVVSSSSEE